MYAETVVKNIDGLYAAIETYLENSSHSIPVAAKSTTPNEIIMATVTRL